MSYPTIDDQRFEVGKVEYNSDGSAKPPRKYLVEIPPGQPCEFFVITEDGFVHRYDRACTPSVRPGGREKPVLDRFRAMQLIIGKMGKYHTDLAMLSPLETTSKKHRLALKQLNESGLDLYVDDMGIINGRCIPNCYINSFYGSILIVARDTKKHVSSKTVAKILNSALELEEVMEFRILTGDEPASNQAVDAGQSSTGGAKRQADDEELSPTIPRARPLPRKIAKKRERIARQPDLADI